MKPTTPTSEPTAPPPQAATPATTPATPNPTSKPVAAMTTEELIAMGNKDPEKLRDYHGRMFAGSVLQNCYESFITKGFISETAVPFAKDTVQQMDARDPLERMLIDQMLWTHVRIARLTTVAIQQTSVKSTQVVNDAADRALNAFRRQVLALQEYRCPKPAASFTAIRQQNIAMLNGGKAPESQNKVVTNEKEMPDATPQPKRLPADTGSVSLPTGIDPARPTVAVGHRAEDARR